MNAFSRLLKILLFSGTWGSYLRTNAEEEKHSVFVHQGRASHVGRLLRGSQQTPLQPHNLNNEVTSSSSSSGESQAPTTRSARELAFDACMVSSLADLLSVVENTGTCPDIFVNKTITISSDVVLDGKNRTLKPATGISVTWWTLFELNGPVHVEIHNFNIHGAVGENYPLYGVLARGEANLTIVSCEIANFPDTGLVVNYHALRDSAVLTVRDSSIFGNAMSGILVSGSSRAGTTKGSVLVQGSTIHDNGEEGIISCFANLSVERSTISNNARFAIGACGEGFGVTVSHSTILPKQNNPTNALVHTENSASISLDNSILVTPSNYSLCTEGSEAIDGGFNAIEGSEYPSCFDGNSSNNTINSTTIVSDNLWLGNLDDNGGPTLTHALLRGSPAIDAGNCSTSVDQEAFDQRGVARPQGSRCDIGAYEVIVAAVVIESSKGRGGGKGCVNANNSQRKQPITIRKQGDSTFDASKVDFASIVIPGFKVFRTKKAHDRGGAGLSLLIERDNTQNVVAGTVINVSGEMFDGAMFAGTLSVCERG